MSYVESHNEDPKPFVWHKTAGRILEEKYSVAADVWSATSYTLLRREALECERHNREHPGAPPRTPRVTQILRDGAGPIVAASDWMKAVPDQIARWVPGPFHSLGTDGFGLSDTRAELRRHFRIDAASIVTAVIAQLVARGDLTNAELARARRELGLDDGPGQVGAAPTAAAEAAIKTPKTRNHTPSLFIAHLLEIGPEVREEVRMYFSPDLF